MPRNGNKNCSGDFFYGKNARRKHRFEEKCISLSYWNKKCYSLIKKQ